MFKKLISILSLTAYLLLITACGNKTTSQPPLWYTTVTTNNLSENEIPSDSIEIDILPYDDQAFTIINNNKPFFTDTEITTESYENYSDLDEYGRCGVATACLSKSTMPAKNEERGKIGMIKPAGWHTVKYPDIIPDLYLYNRCHLIGWQLSAENANEKNLITGTRYLNIEGMLPFENQVANYINETNNHVMYRVTPKYTNNDLICRGIMIEAQSVEDKGCVFCVYCYNVQPGIDIDYETGDSRVLIKFDAADTEESTPVTTIYILNTKSMKIHKPTCSAAETISETNKSEYTGDMQTLLDHGYSPCKMCNPE